MFIFLIFHITSSPTQIASDIVFRVLDRDGWTGTNTPFNGCSGFLLEITDEIMNNIDEFFSKPRKAPEVLLLPLKYTSDANIKKIESIYHPKPYLQGFVIMGDSKSTVAFGEAFPNKEYSFYKVDSSFKWNPNADGMVKGKYKHPIIYPSLGNLKLIKEHMIKNGKKAGMFLDLFQQSRVNDEKCLKEKRCKPIYGVSIFGGFEDGFDGKSVWAVTSFDSFGLFPYGDVAADYSVSGFITLLTALSLFKDVDWKTAKNKLRFAFFDAEDSGYFGSGKFLQDISSFKCKENLTKNGEVIGCKYPYRSNLKFMDINLNDIEAVVEIRQDAKLQKLYAHSMSSSHEFVDKNILEGQDYIEVADRNLPGIPPGSTHTFLKHNQSLNHVVLTGFQSIYPADNKYGSPSDSEYNSTSIQKSAIALAKTLAKLCGVTLPSEDLNLTIVDELMSAFVNNASSSNYLSEQLLKGYNLPSDHFSLYSGVYINGYTISTKHLIVREFLRDILAFNITDIQCNNDSVCGNLECSKSRNVCVDYNFNYHPAYSNAYEIKDSEDYYIVNNSVDLPRKCESNWKVTDFKLTTYPSYRVGRFTLGIGILFWILFSVLFSLLWNKSFVILENSNKK